MLELFIAVVAGALVNRVGAKLTRSLPNTHPLKKPGAVVFGGGGPVPTK